MIATDAALAALLGRLDPEQRAAATAPPGPTLCIAPAGSGKTTTLVARLAWLLAGAPPAERARPGEVCAVTFNRRAAEELTERTRAALGPLGLPPEAVRIRTFHALAREILVDAGAVVDPLVDRPALLRTCFPTLTADERARLDDAIARLKIDHGITVADIAAYPDPSPLGRAFLRYEAALADLGGLDFDDLVIRAGRTLEAQPALLDRWRRRCRDLLVDEVQDVDRAQLHLILLLAAPRNRVFLVGDDDQTIYAWRLADVRRILDLDRSLPGLRRVDLATNYRCPRVVVERAVRLVERNQERFPKAIRARPGAYGRLLLAPIDGAADEGAAAVAAILDAWDASSPRDGTRAILARTNRELLPVAAVALERGLPFRIPRLAGPLLDPALEGLLAAIEAADPRLPLLRRIAAAADALGVDEASDGEPATPDGHHDPREDLAHPLERPAPDEEANGSSSGLVQAVLGWAARFDPGDATAFVTAVRGQRDRIVALRRDDARLTLSTVHAVKGLEFDDVAVLGLTADAFPNARSVAAALEPERAFEEERRLAYVAWTRARRSLTLVFDPARPSPFLLEAFDPHELAAAIRGAPSASRHGGGASGEGARWPRQTRPPPPR